MAKQCSPQEAPVHPNRCPVLPTITAGNDNGMHADIPDITSSSALHSCLTHMRNGDPGMASSRVCYHSAIDNPCAKYGQQGCADQDNEAPGAAGCVPPVLGNGCADPGWGSHSTVMISVEAAGCVRAVLGSGCTEARWWSHSTVMTSTQPQQLNGNDTPLKNVKTRCYIVRC